MKRTILFAAAAAGVVAAALLGLPALAARFDRRDAGRNDFAEELRAPDGSPYWLLTTGAANAWLLPCDGGYFLIDSGYPEDWGRFSAGMEAAGLDIRSIRALFITHAHDEHAGFAARLKEETGCVLLLPRESLPDLERGRFIWTGVSANPAIDALGRLYNLVKGRTFGFDPVVPRADDLILVRGAADAARSFGIRGTFLHTPGHSADSWSLVLDDGRAFVGDAAMNTLAAFGAGHRPIFMEDRRETYRSMEAVRAAGAVLIHSGHGPAFPADALPRFREEADRGPGVGALGPYSLKLLPGFLLVFLLLYLLRDGPRLARAGVYILGFILMRDLMTGAGFWSFDSAPVFWLRFAADGSLLFLLAAGSLAASLAILAFERNRGGLPVWIRGRALPALAAGAAGAAAAAGPLLLAYSGILPGERGGAFPVSLAPALLAVALCGNLLEELLFRGFLQEELAASGLGERRAAAASGIAFGLCHVFLAYTVTEVGLPLVLFAAWEGCICGALKKRFGLLSAVLAHGLAVFALSFF